MLRGLPADPVPARPKKTGCPSRALAHIAHSLPLNALAAAIGVQRLRSCPRIFARSRLTVLTATQGQILLVESAKIEFSRLTAEPLREALIWA